MVALLFIPVLIGILVPPLGLIILLTRTRPPGERPRRYNNWIGWVLDLSTIIVLPAFGAFFLSIIKADSVPSVVWLCLCGSISISYFFAIDSERFKSPTAELILSGMMAGGVILNIAMGFWLKSGGFYFIANGPIAALFLYAMVKRHHYLAWRLDGVSGVLKYGHEEILDYTHVHPETDGTITATNSLGQQLLPVLHLPWATRFLIYAVVGLVFIMAVAVASGLISGDVLETINYFFLGP